jgi:hypothetical protein
MPPPLRSVPFRHHDLRCTALPWWRTLYCLGILQERSHVDLRKLSHIALAPQVTKLPHILLPAWTVQQVHKCAPHPPPTLCNSVPAATVTLHHAGPVLGHVHDAD